MGIRDRDYMKRPSDGDGYDDSRPSSRPKSKAEEIAEQILKKYSRLFVYCGIGLVILIVAALIVTKFSAGGH